MAYDEGLAERVRGLVEGADVGEMKMFGGVAWPGARWRLASRSPLAASGRIGPGQPREVHSVHPRGWPNPLRRRIGRRALAPQFANGLLVGGHMACGIVGVDLMVRVGPDAHEGALAQPHARPMDFAGRPMVGMVYVAPAGVTDEGALDVWVDGGVTFARTLPPKAPKPPRAAKAEKAPGARSGAAAQKCR